jgi:superfamily II DNA or RNA helicase
MPVLRPYIPIALDALKQAHQRGQRKNLVVMATGTGKTVFMSHVPQTLDIPGQWLLWVHRKELMKQAVDKLRKWNPGLRVGVEMANQRCDPKNDQVVVASVQSLHEGSTRLTQFDPAAVAGIMIDECHHLTQDNSYGKLLNYFSVNPNLFLLGVTATDKRADGKSLGTVFTNVPYSYPMYDAVKDGYLADLKGIKVTTVANLDTIKTVKGEFDQGQLEETVNTNVRNDQIVDAWIENANNVQSIAFTVGIDHAKALAQSFRAKGVKAEAIWGEDPERDSKLDRHRSGDLTILCNDNVLTEGYDDWRIACVVDAAPTKSCLRYVQRLGRGTRIPDDIDNIIAAKARGETVAKDSCLVIDVVDNTSKHSLITLSSAFGLNQRLNLRGQSIFAVKERIESLAAENENLDAAGIEDYDQLDKIIEQVDLWAVKYPDEILKETANKWHKTVDGQYYMAVSSTEGARVWTDVLDRWFCHFKVGQNEFHEGNFKTRREALKYADRMLRLVDTDRARWQQRERFGGDKPATRTQLNILDGLKVKYPPIITMGEASKLITQYTAKNFSLRH